MRDTYLCVLRVTRERLDVHRLRSDTKSYHLRNDNLRCLNQRGKDSSLMARHTRPTRTCVETRRSHEQPRLQQLNTRNAKKWHLRHSSSCKTRSRSTLHNPLCRFQPGNTGFHPCSHRRTRRHARLAPRHAIVTERTPRYVGGCCCCVQECESTAAGRTSTRVCAVLYVGAGWAVSWYVTLALRTRRCTSVLSLRPYCGPATWVQRRARSVHQSMLVTPHRRVIARTSPA